LSTAAHFFIPGHSLVGGLVSISSFLTISIPILAAVYGISRFIRPYNLNPGFKRGVRFTWIAALFVTIYGIIDTIKDNQDRETYTTSEEYDIQGGTITFDMVNPDNYYNGLFHLGNMEFTGSKLYSDGVLLNIEKAEGDKLIIDKVIESSGRSSHKAILNAKAIDHNLEVTEDGTIKIDTKFSLTRGEKFRGQYIELNIKVPEGKQLEFDDRAGRFIVSSYFDENVERPHTLKKHSWTMGENGLIAQSWLKANKYKKSVDLKDVVTINIKGDFEVDLSKSSDSELSMVGRQELVDQMSIVMQDNILTIADENEIMDYPVKLYIKIPELLNLNSSSDQKHRIEGFNQDKMNILLTGGGDLNAYLDIKDLNITAEERPNINLTGVGETLFLDMDYYTEFNAENYEVDVLRLKNKMGRAKVKVHKLIKSLTDISDRMKVYGDPEIMIGKENFKETIEEAIQEAIEEVHQEIKEVKEIKKEVKEVVKEVVNEARTGGERKGNQ
jgi:hypothetical protein